MIPKQQFTGFVKSKSGSARFEYQVKNVRKGWPCLLLLGVDCFHNDNISSSNLTLKLIEIMY